ncbi:hypothetical protein [Marinobacter daepoensis]|uniref:hypothetical protein n=1 Tax=Marinobacter daepoensis TaxID=262077 RepID=UPI000425C05A|nr:hypothetical protein [Marinobacter daepoensis]
MNPHMLDIALPESTRLTLQKIPLEANGSGTGQHANTSFEMIAENGQVVGYVKTWHEADGYAGYVRFDSEGNVQDWKVLRDRQ